MGTKSWVMHNPKKWVMQNLNYVKLFFGKLMVTISSRFECG